MKSCQVEVFGYPVGLTPTGEVGRVTRSYLLGKNTLLAYHDKASEILIIQVTL